MDAVLVRATYICCALLLAGCVTPISVLPERALVDIADITEAREIEAQTNDRADISAPVNLPWFEVVNGGAAVIVTAAHATRPMREGQYRFSDGGGTAALALLLNKLCGATAIYTTYQSPSDPNFYDDNAFKETLGRLLRDKRSILVLDVHGSHAYRPYDVDDRTFPGQHDASPVSGRRAQRAVDRGSRASKGVTLRRRVMALLDRRSTRIFGRNRW